MSSNKHFEEHQGVEEGATGETVSSVRGELDSCPPSKASNENMKRHAARQLIERYYYQLTDGCGSADCSNDSCASSQGFKFKTLSKDQAAAKSLELFRQKALLCHLPSSRPFKVPKNGSPEGASSAESSTSPEVRSSTPSESASSEPLPGAASTSSDVVSMEVPSVSTETTASSSQPQPTSSPESEPAYLSEAILTEIVSKCETSKNWSLLIRTLGSVFNNPDCVKRSFLLPKEDLQEMDVDPDKDAEDPRPVEAMDSCDSDEDSSAQSTSASPHHGHVRLKNQDNLDQVDIDSLRKAFSKLFAIPESTFQNALTNALRSLARTMEVELRYHQAYEREPNYLNVFVIVFEILILDNRGDLENAIPHILKAAGVLPLVAQARLARLWATYPFAKLKEMLGFLHQVITLRILSSTQYSSVYIFNEDDDITSAARVMKILYYASILGGQMDSPALLDKEKLASKEEEASLQELLEGAMGREKEKVQPREDALGKALAVDPLDCRKPVLPWEDFINDLISDGIRMEKDYAIYKGDSEGKFSFLTHSFLLTTAMKNLGMYYDSKIRMVNERRVSLLQSLVNGAPSMPYLRIRIRRDHVIDDALVNLEMVAMDNPGDLKKQLYVEFEGEQGIDEGGVSKEFFQLVVEEIFNPDIGMFVHNEETHTFWFNPTSFENDSQFTLIGIVLGLAIYNNIILDVHFPGVVYRKLMGKLGTFSDLADSHPTLTRSLQQLLDYEGDVESDFLQTFSISYTDIFGTCISHDLRDGGEKIPVTNDNRQEYVDLYADFLLNKSIEKQFRAFRRGFQMVTDESPLKMLFQPTEVELLVCGSKHWDFQALEVATEYDGGFTPESQVIKYFWEVVHDFSSDQKKKLLQFATGSDRVPVGGLSKLKLVIARNGPDSDRLPTAHTCFNVLLLPDYNTKDKLQERLMKAILYAKGFGML